MGQAAATRAVRGGAARKQTLTNAPPAVALLAALALAFTPRPARAAATAVAPGETYDLTGELTLAGDDTFSAGDAAGARCTIHGNGHGLVAADGWTGAVTIHNCDIDGLGAADTFALDLRASGGARIVIEGSRFSRSSRVRLNISEHVDVVYRGNTIDADSVVPAVTLLLDSPPTFWSTGSTDGMKLFQGNRIFKARVKFTSTSGWMVGGPLPADGNVLLGVRTGIELENASNMTVQGNYSHTFAAGERWNQVKNLSISGGDGMVIEHNVFWGRNWLVEMNGGGELRYNLLVNAVERGWVLAWADIGAKVHHNLAIATRETIDAPTGGFVLEGGKTSDAPATTEIFNNTLDLADRCAPGVGAAVMLKGDAMLQSLRSNALTGARVADDPGAALVRPYEATSGPVHLAYSDYNLFYTPDSPNKTSYGVTVAGKRARVDPGFGYHDLPTGGALNQQVEPRFAGPLPRTFPFSEDAVKAGTTTTCQILAYYRQVYAPAAGSPLIDAGDPADGEGNDVGAIGAGVPNPTDRFGRMCDESDIGQPTMAAAIFTCQPVPIGGAPSGDGAGEASGEGAGAPAPDLPRGITCVCAAGAGAPRPPGLLGGAGLALLALARRRRRPARVSRP